MCQSAINKKKCACAYIYIYIYTYIHTYIAGTLGAFIVTVLGLSVPRVLLIHPSESRSPTPTADELRNPPKYRRVLWLRCRV